MARSKAYPTASLSECVALARKIWDAHNRKQMTLEEATQSLGYKGVSGPSRSKISAMKQFGLLEEPASNTLRLSQRAIDVLHKPEGDPARQEAIHAALGGVEIFAHLARTHAEASEGAIVSTLLTDHEFTDVGARTAAQSFLESIKFAGGVGGTISHEAPEDTPERDSGNRHTRQHSPPPPPVGQDMKQETCSIGEGRAVIEWPVTRTQAEWDDLEYWLQGVIRKAKRDVGLNHDPEPKPNEPDGTTDN